VADRAPFRERPSRAGLRLLVLLAAFSTAASAGLIGSVAVAQDSTGSSTITVRLLPNEPVREITAREVLLVGSTAEPTLEIAGRDDPVTGTAGRIVICKLVLRKVDAVELKAVNTEAKTLDAVDVVAPGGSAIAVNPDLIVECGRGGAAVLALGVESVELGDLQPGTGQGPTQTEGREGVRMNRLRILGPPGAEGFIETLVLERSSVFGRIELRNLQIKELVLDSVTAQN
jgi:hypothetical protein